MGQASPLGSDVFAPALALTNFGTTPVKATVTLAVTGGNGPNGQTVATVTVAGQSSVTVPLEALNGDSQMRNSFTVQSDAARGALYASMTVFGGATIPAVQLLGRDWGQPYNGGAHPWTTAAGATSTLLLFNYSDAPLTFSVVITSEGALWQRRYQLAALETKSLDIGNLIATGARDENGLVLPPVAAAGVAQWFTPGNGAGTGRLLVSQPNTGQARGFGCLTVVTLCGTSSLSNSSVNIAAGSSGTMGPFMADMCMSSVGACGGSYNLTTSYAANWVSSNASVASLSSATGQSGVTINGNSAGSATIGATPLPDTYKYFMTGQQWTCYAAQQTGWVTVYDPGPSNVSISPTSFTVGTAASFTISGNNLGTNCPTLSFPFAASYTLNSPCTDSQITGTLTANAAGIGDFTLSSGGFGGQGFLPSPGQSQNTTSSTTVTATAACPTSAVIMGITPLPLASGLQNNFPNYLTGFGAVMLVGLGPGPYTYNGATVTEAFSNITTTCPANIQQYATCNGSDTFTAGPANNQGNTIQGHSCPKQVPAL